jgi:hypothetical protein
MQVYVAYMHTYTSLRCAPSYTYTRTWSLYVMYQGIIAALPRPRAGIYRCIVMYIYTYPRVMCHGSSTTTCMYVPCLCKSVFVSRDCMFRNTYMHVWHVSTLGAGKFRLVLVRLVCMYMYTYIHTQGMGLLWKRERDLL